MPRSYKPDLLGKTYTKHPPEAINQALADHKRGMSFCSCLKNMEFRMPSFAEEPKSLM